LIPQKCLHDNEADTKKLQEYIVKVKRELSNLQQEHALCTANNSRAVAASAQSMKVELAHLDEETNEIGNFYDTFKPTQSIGSDGDHLVFKADLKYVEDPILKVNDEVFVLLFNEYIYNHGFNNTA